MNGDELKRVVSNLSQNNILVVSFCNDRYKQVAINWKNYLDRLNIKNYLIIATDEDAYKYLKSFGINVILIYGKLPRRSGFGWKWRTKILCDLIFTGINIIHSDLDAVWVKNPISLISKNYDMIISKDLGGYPPETTYQWGFCVCPGWMYIRSSNNSKIFLSDMISSGRDFDDQAKMNEFLLKYSKLINSVFLELTDGSYELQCEKINVKILDTDLIVRGDKIDDNCYVIHPHMRKASDCETQMKRRGLWLE